MCTSCINRGYEECIYDIIGDRRRTTALKERIDELEVEAGNLRAVITGICVDPDHERSISVAEQLVAGGFQELPQAADTLRRVTNRVDSVDVERGRGQAALGDLAVAYPHQSRPVAQDASLMPAQVQTVDQSAVDDLLLPLNSSPCEMYFPPYYPAHEGY